VTDCEQAALSGEDALRVVYSSFIGGTAPTALQVMAKTTFTATLPNGETIKRTTERTYSHVVVREMRYADGTVAFVFPEWAGRLDLAQKNAAKNEKQLAKHVGQDHGQWFKRYDAYRVHMIPVNA